MNFMEICLARFSARKYTDELVSDEDMTYILESLQAAPSAVNRQPWKFVVVKSEEAKEKLQRCYDRDWFKTAPVYVIAFKNVLSDPLASSIKGSLTGNLSDPHNTVCSTMCATPVLSFGGVRNPILNTLFSSSFSIRATLAPVFLCRRR